MKIVVLDGYTENPGDLSWAPLEKYGELTVYDRTSYVDSPLIAERIGDAEIVIINKTPITKETIDKCPNIKLIAVLATGYNVVDYNYAKEKGIPVANVPTYGTQIVGQYAVGLLMEICSHYGHHAQTVAEGKWENNADWCYWDYPMIELYGKTAGIIGLGRIGQATAKILNSMDMKVIAYDAYESEAGKKLAEYVDLDTLFAQSDVIFLHCPLFPETEGIINKENIAKMKDGVILINNSRGQLVVDQDLVFDLLYRLFDGGIVHVEMIPVHLAGGGFADVALPVFGIDLEIGAPKAFGWRAGLLFLTAQQVAVGGHRLRLERFGMELGWHLAADRPEHVFLLGHGDHPSGGAVEELDRLAQRLDPADGEGRGLFGGLLLLLRGGGGFFALIRGLAPGTDPRAGRRLL